MASLSLKPHNREIVRHFPKQASQFRPRQLLSLHKNSILKSALPSLSLCSSMGSPSSSIGSSIVRQIPKQASPFRPRQLPKNSILNVKASASGATDEGLEGDSFRLDREHDLLIICPDGLGRLIGQKWLEEFPGCQVFGQTTTLEHHEELEQIGITPCTKPSKQFSYVVLCAPQPSEYYVDVKPALSSWNGQGCFLFISCDGQQGDQDYVLLEAEIAVIDNEGSVLKLATLDLNLIQDAASRSLEILKANIRRSRFSHYPSNDRFLGDGSPFWYILLQKLSKLL